VRPIAQPTDSVDVSCTVNGEQVRIRTAPRRLLSDVLRDDLGLTGTHVGCEHGICGACTVLLDGAPTRSCLTLAVQVDGAEVTTTEGVTPADGFSPMQQAFISSHAFQCGFCTPGILMTLAGVDPEDYPDDEHIRDLLSGTLCRCTGYENIVAAVRNAWGRA
jgi:carbon-monoxide dehydrogenase small subunit